MIGAGTDALKHGEVQRMRGWLSTWLPQNTETAVARPWSCKRMFQYQARMFDNDPHDP